MPENPKPRRRLNILGRAERTRRIFGRLRDGWAYDEIAREERVSTERIRQIVSEVLGKRVIDRGSDHAHIQLERLKPALHLVNAGIARGDIKAVSPLIKIIDRLDKHQVTVVARDYYGPEETERLIAKMNAIVANLAPDPDEGDPAAETPLSGSDAASADIATNF
jgi:hypothetical protein